MSGPTRSSGAVSGTGSGSGTGSLSRRGVVAATAWAVPAVAVSVGAPTAAASTPVPSDRTAIQLSIDPHYEPIDRVLYPAIDDFVRTRVYATGTPLTFIIDATNGGPATIPAGLQVEIAIAAGPRLAASAGVGEDPVQDVGWTGTTLRGVAGAPIGVEGRAVLFGDFEFARLENGGQLVRFDVDWVVRLPVGFTTLTGETTLARRTSYLLRDVEETEPEE